LRAIETELASLNRQVDGVHARILVADARTQASIVEAEMPAYRRLVEARDRGKAVLDKREADIQAFLVDLRHRGVFQSPCSPRA
jgi:hypothetical protein